MNITSMMKANTPSGLLPLWPLAALVLAACGNLAGPANEEKTVVFNPPQRAVPMAASTTGEPKVLDSYYDNTSNYYLIDVGHVRNTYVSTLFLKHYNGVTPVSATAGVKTELSTSIKEGIPGAEVSASAKFEWNASVTASESETGSKSALYSEVQRISDSETTSVTIGEHNEPAGHYRYALYAVCDVYFLLRTSRDNQQLQRLETVVSARNEQMMPYFEYTADGVFDNSPADGSAITFDKDFYKRLALPSKKIDELPIPIPVSSVYVYDGDALKITDTTGHVHTYNRPIDLDISALKAAGYTKIIITMDVQIRAQNKGGDRAIWLDIDGSQVWKISALNVDWTSWQRRTYTQTVDISAIHDASVFRFGFENAKKDLWTSNIWFFNEATVTFQGGK